MLLPTLRARLALASPGLRGTLVRPPRELFDVLGKRCISSFGARYAPENSDGGDGAKKLEGEPVDASIPSYVIFQIFHRCRTVLAIMGFACADTSASTFRLGAETKGGAIQPFGVPKEFPTVCVKCGCCFCNTSG